MTKLCRQQPYRFTTSAQTCNQQLQQALLHLAAARLSIARATGHADDGDKQILTRIMSDLRLSFYAVDIRRSRLLLIEQLQESPAEVVLP